MMLIINILQKHLQLKKIIIRLNTVFDSQSILQKHPRNLFSCDLSTNQFDQFSWFVSSSQRRFVPRCGNLLLFPCYQFVAIVAPGCRSHDLLSPLRSCGSLPILGTIAGHPRPNISGIIAFNNCFRKPRNIKVSLKYKLLFQEFKNTNIILSHKCKLIPKRDKFCSGFFLQVEKIKYVLANSPYLFPIYQYIRYNWF